MRKKFPKLSIAIEDYLQALLNAGLYGNTRDEVIERMICYGIERTIGKDTIPARWPYPQYNVASSSA